MIKLYKIDIYIFISNTAKSTVSFVIFLNYLLNDIIIYKSVFSYSIAFTFVKIPGNTSEKNNGIQNENEISQQNLNDQASTSNTKSE